MGQATGLVERAEALYGRLLEALALVACALLFLMMLVICADVLLRNVALLPRMRGVEWSNEASEATLYLITMLAAPWLMRRGQHIRVDILLRAIPKRAAWYCEWACDAIALACCALMVAYGAQSALASRAAGSLSIKTLVTPEWWALALLPAVFILLAIEMCFRLIRLYEGDRAPRKEAVSAA